MATRSLNAQQEFDGNLGELDAACVLMLITSISLEAHAGSDKKFWKVDEWKRMLYRGVGGVAKK
jgi:hypothetical protein